MVRTKKTLTILLSLIILVCGIAGAGLSAEAASYKTVDGKFNYSYSTEVLRLVNEERAKYGLSSLTMTKSLTDGAMIRAAESAVSFSHTRPNGEQCFTAFTWTKTAGENIAYGQRSPAQVVNSWMNSSGHRANILNASFTTIGVGCFEYGGTLYWAQAFSGGSGNAYTPSGTRTVSVKVSLTAGEGSAVTFTDNEVTTVPSTTREAVTKAETTAKQQTTAARETTTKRETTTNTQTTTKPQTTKTQSTTRKKTNIIRYVRYYFARLFK